MFDMPLIQGCIFFAIVLQNAAYNDPKEVTTPHVKQPKAAETPIGIDSNGHHYDASTNETIECGGYANCTSRSRSCYCDEFCSRYNDCCQDVEDSLDSYSRSADIKIASSSCQSVSIDKHIPVWVVSRCPGSEQECMPNKTTAKDIEDIIPVTGNDNFVYVNRKCAQCHDVHQYTHWYLSITSNFECKLLAQSVTVSSLTEMLGNNDCGLMLIQPYGTSFPRKCVPNIKSVDGCPSDRKPLIGKLAGTNYLNEVCCIKDTMSHCTIHQYTCFNARDEDPLTPDDLAGKLGKLDLNPSTWLLQFGQVLGRQVEINGVHYINPQFRVIKRFQTDGELNDSIRIPFVCVLHKYFMIRDLQMEEITLRLDSIECSDQTTSKFVLVSDFNVKALKYFTNAEEIRNINIWLDTMEVTFRMVDERDDILLTTVSAIEGDTKCQNGTVHELFAIKLRQKFLKPLSPIFAQNSRICALLENGEYTHPPSKQSGRCLMNNITAIQASSEVSVDMTCSDTKLELPDETSSGTVICVGGSTHVNVLLTVVVFLTIANFL